MERTVYPCPTHVNHREKEYRIAIMFLYALCCARIGIIGSMPFKVEQVSES